MSLDESISSGQAGHILDHEVIHARLKDEGSNGKLWHHRKALKAAADGTARLVIGYLGDSTVEGAGISSIEDRAINVCQRILRERFTTADTGRGYIPAFYGTGVTPSEEPVLAGSTTERGTEGLGFRSLALNASGAMATWELHGTDMVLCYASYAGAPGPKSEYRIDGGAWVEVDHLGGSGLDFREEQLAVSLGAEDDYTVDWRWKSDGAGAAPHPVIEGIIEINGDPDKGILVLDMGRSGQTASFFADNVGNELLPQWISDHDVTLLVIGLGYNEWQTATSVATYKSDLQSLISQLRDGNADLEVVLHGGYTPFAEGDPDDWPDYVDAMHEVAAADDLTSVFDIARAMPQPTYIDYTDHYDGFGLHPTAAGGNAIGAADADHLSLRSGGGYSQEWIPTVVQDALDLKAALASPALTGNPTAPTQTVGNDSTRIASTAFVAAAGALHDGPGYVSAARIGPAWLTITARSMAQGNLFLVPYYVRSTVTLDRLFVEISTAGTGSTVVRLGIWNHDASTGKPGTLVVDAGTVSGTGLAEVGATINQQLTRGWYWFGAVAQTVTGSPAVRGYTQLQGAAAELIGPGNSISVALTPTCALLVSSVTGAFSTLVGASFSFVISTGPIIQGRVA